MRIACSVFAVFLAGSCSTLDIYKPNQATLSSALKDIESGQPASLERAEASARSVLVSTTDVAKNYRLQRFFAQYLLARLHMEASAKGAFLKEPQVEDSIGLGGGARARGSEVAHLVATSYHSAYGIDLYPSAVGQPLTIKGQALLPPELQAMGVDSAGKHLQLCLLTAYKRLRFEEMTAQILDGIGATDLATLNQIVEDGQASSSMKPWIYRAMWARLKGADPQDAYQYAAACLESADDLEPGAENIHGKAIATWLEESTFKFVCSSCETPVSVDSRTCSLCSGSEWRHAVYLGSEPATE